jgi:hypothetical protein
MWQHEGVLFLLPRHSVVSASDAAAWLPALAGV